MSDSLEQPSALKDVPNEIVATNLPAGSELASATLLADDLLKYINKTPDMISMLYDLDMLPEQLTRESRDWYLMLVLASWHRTKSEQVSQRQAEASGG